MGFLADFLIRIGADSEDVKKVLSSTRKDLQSWGRDLNAVGASLTTAISVPIAGIGVAAIKMAGELEQNSVAFKTMLKSADEAQKHLTELKDFALTTPFQFNDLVLASKRLQALGFEAKSVIPTLRNVGDAAAALGLGAEGIQRVVTALGQIKAKGTVQAEEMRQLAEAGIPAWDILAKTLNTTVADAMKQVEARAVSAGTAVPAILAGMNERFGGLMEQQSKTLLGQFSNLKDAITFTLQDIGKAILPIATGVMQNAIQPMLEGVKDLAANFAAMPQSMQTGIVAIAGLAAVLPPVIWGIGQLTTGFSSIIALALKLPALLNPITLAVAALGTAAGAAFYELHRSTANLSALDQDFGKFIGDAIKNTKDFAATRDLLNRSLETGAIGASQFAQSMAMLEQEEKKSINSGMAAYMGDLGLNIKVVTDSTQKASAATEDLSGKAEIMRENFRGIPWAEMSQEGAIWTAVVEKLAQRQNALNDSVANYRVMMMGFIETPPDISKLSNAMDAANQKVIDLMNQMSHAANQAKDDWDLAWDKFNNSANADRAKKQIQDISGGWKPVIKEAESAGKQMQQVMSRAFSRMERDIARNIVQWKGWGNTLKSIAQDVAEGFLSIMLHDLLKPLEDQMAKWASKIAGILLDKIGGALGGIFGAGGSAASAAGSAAGSAGSAAGGIGGAVGGAISGVTGILGAVGSIGSMVSGIIGNFQMSGMSKDLGNMERTMAGLLNQVRDGIQPQINAYLPELASIRGVLWEHVMPAFAELIDAVKDIKSGGGVTVNLYGVSDPNAAGAAVVRQLKLAGVVA